jgi:hypothetical protein
MNLGSDSPVRPRPVRNPRLSTATVHRRNRLTEPRRDVFPVVHTLYVYYERF